MDAIPKTLQEPFPTPERSIGRVGPGRADRVGGGFEFVGG
jgi:hypothetical protein